MSGGEVLQLAGSALMLVFAAALAFVALHAFCYSRFGREALLVAAGFVAGMVLVRMLVLFGVVSDEDGRAVSGLVAAWSVAILVQIAYLKRNGCE